MIHGLCGDDNPIASCCIHDKRDVQSIIQWNFNQDLILIRIEKLLISNVHLKKEGKTSEVKFGNEKVTITNQWAVLCNVYLLKTLNFHINIEIFASLQAVKYLLWYLFKGNPCVMASVKDSNNEIETYANMRTIGPLEVFW